MAPVRVRQHVNPLSQKFQAPIALPDWTQVYGNLAQPLHLDIGSARGQFLLGMAQQQPQWNFLGLEIREPLVKRATQARDRAQLANLHFLFCNVNLDVNRILRSLPAHALKSVTIQFPDPWFKQRHRKRRVVQPQFVQTLSEYLASDGQILLQSDVQEVAIAMTAQFQAHPVFQSWQLTHPTGSPFPIATEREALTLAKGQPVYRTLLQMA